MRNWFFCWCFQAPCPFHFKEEEMKQNALFIIFCVLSSIILLNDISHAITVTATPNPATVNQNVTVNINADFSTSGRVPSCAIEVNWGDNTSWVTAGICTTTRCDLVANHIYTIAGHYRITVRSSPDPGLCRTPPEPPDPVTTSVTVRCTPLNITSPSTLPSGTQGQSYSYQLMTSGGNPPVQYSLISGSLPPGLALGASGLISGTPTTAGDYSFTIRASDSCPARVQTQQMTFSLRVNAFSIPPSSLSVSVTPTPSSFSVPRGITSTHNLSYMFIASTAADIDLYSTDGEFIAGGQVIGNSNTGLIVPIRNTTGMVSETLTIPVSVLKRAENLGTTKIIYNRTFSDRNISVLSSIDIMITTEAGAPFRITRLQIYFENHRAEITVKRNQPSLKVYADVRFTGSGLLQGYWEVDGRILSNVNQHLVYGRTITIETPDIPALPTFDPGTHSVRFVITSPSEGILSPVAIYFVTAEEFKKIFHIRLISPDDSSEVNYSPPVFRWEGSERLSVYLLEFYEAGGDKPVFSAYAKDTRYSLPGAVFKRIFSPGRVYRWRVKGFDTQDSISGESNVFRFVFKEPASYVPGQIVVVANSMELLKKLELLYKLEFIEGFDIKSLNVRMAVFQTDEDIFRLIDIIRKEDGVVLAQPNHILRTLSEPMSDMQNIYRILNLSSLHKYYRGKGVVVAIIDTGVDTGHRDLRESIIESENLLRDSPYQAEIHGTAVAGIIGAGINGFGIEGIAPEAGILALRACRQVSEVHPEGECYTSSVAKALDISIEKGARVVNMSIGSASPDRLIKALIEEGARKGMIFVAPAGNMPYMKEVAFPASHPDVIAVAGMDDSGNPYPNPEIASKAMVSAPATNVFTTIPGNKHNFLSGTSMASASVTGIITLAVNKDKGTDRHNLPEFNGDICKWQEELLEMPICER